MIIADQTCLICMRWSVWCPLRVCKLCLGCEISKHSRVAVFVRYCRGEQESSMWDDERKPLIVILRACARGGISMCLRIACPRVAVGSVNDNALENGTFYPILMPLRILRGSYRLIWLYLVRSMWVLVIYNFGKMQVMYKMGSEIIRSFWRQLHRALYFLPNKNTRDGEKHILSTWTGATKTRQKCTIQLAIQSPSLGLSFRRKYKARSTCRSGIRLFKKKVWLKAVHPLQITNHILNKIWDDHV